MSRGLCRLSSGEGPGWRTHLGVVSIWVIFTAQEWMRSPAGDGEGPERSGGWAKAPGLHSGPPLTFFISTHLVWAQQAPLGQVLDISLASG